MKTRKTNCVSDSDVAAARDGDSKALERALAGSRQDLRRYAEHHCAVNDTEKFCCCATWKVEQSTRYQRVWV